MAYLLCLDHYMHFKDLYINLFNMAAALPSLNSSIFFFFVARNFKVCQILNSAKLNILVIT